MTCCLVIDDDARFRDLLGDALRAAGREVRLAASSAEALAQLPSDEAVLDLNLGGESGLRLIPALLAASPGIRIVVLTGYATIATAVEAMKLGAVHYLVKPAPVSELLRALTAHGADVDAPVRTEAVPLRDAEWQYLREVLAQHGGNISAAARALGMHRRSLQRKLDKMPNDPRQG